MARQIEIEEIFDHLAERPLIDVRTPAEFAKGHIPGAHNLPLFTNEERAVVGTAYKQESPEEALLRGLEFVGPKMRSFVEQSGQISGERQVVVHCWRGGRRSESMGWLLKLAGFDVLTVRGGYKAYRNYILQSFEKRTLPLIVLGGYTGSGKTEVLKALAARGEQVIDLEGLARHKGSAFGALGEAGQPSVEQFENDLYEAFRAIDPGRRVWVEDESQSIGRVYIPLGFWRQMRRAPVFFLDIPRPERVRYLVESYAQFPKEQLAGSFTRIQKRLGGRHLQVALAAMDAGDFAKAAEIGLQYYDKAYRFGLNKRGGDQIHHFEVVKINPEKVADRLLQFVRQGTFSRTLDVR